MLYRNLRFSGYGTGNRTPSLKQSIKLHAPVASEVMESLNLFRQNAPERQRGQSVNGKISYGVRFRAGERIQCGNLPQKHQLPDMENGWWVSVPWHIPYMSTPTET
jgi:hypothetical protein